MKRRFVLIFAIVFLLLIPIRAAAEDAPDEPTGNVVEQEPSSAVSTGNDPGTAEALSDLFIPTHQFGNKRAVIPQ